MDRALTDQVRERYSPGQVCVLWPAMLRETPTERFTLDLLWRWERAADLFLESIAPFLERSPREISPAPERPPRRPARRSRREPPRPPDEEEPAAARAAPPQDDTVEEDELVRRIEEAPADEEAPRLPRGARSRKASRAAGSRKGHRGVSIEEPAAHAPRPEARPPAVEAASPEEEPLATPRRRGPGRKREREATRLAEAGDEASVVHPAARRRACSEALLEPGPADQRAPRRDAAGREPRCGSGVRSTPGAVREGDGGAVPPGGADGPPSFSLLSDGALDTLQDLEGFLEDRRRRDKALMEWKRTGF